MSSTSNFSSLLIQAEGVLKKEHEALLKVCQMLQNEVEHYNWVGFYFMNSNTNQLEVGPYVGAKTEHTSIPFGKGICGQVAESGETFVVDDVTEQDNYLACSIDTKAEIVVPLYYKDKLIGQIDIDSNQRNPFTKDDEQFLKSLCEKIADYPHTFTSHLPE